MNYFSYFKHGEYYSIFINLCWPIFVCCARYLKVNMNEGECVWIAFRLDIPQKGTSIKISMTSGDWFRRFFQTNVIVIRSCLLESPRPHILHYSPLSITEFFNDNWDGVRPVPNHESSSSNVAGCRLWRETRLLSSERPLLGLTQHQRHRVQATVTF